MRSGAGLRGGSPLVSSDHVIDAHFVTFSSSLYTTISNPNANASPNTNHNPNHIHNPNPNPSPNPDRNPTVITDPQIGRRDPQIVTVQIRPADLPRSAFCRVPLLSTLPTSFDLDMAVITGSASLALTTLKLPHASSSSFLACKSRLRSAVRRSHPPQRPALGHIECSAM